MHGNFSLPRQAAGLLTERGWNVETAIMRADGKIFVAAFPPGGDYPIFMAGKTVSEVMVEADEHDPPKPWSLTLPPSLVRRYTVPIVS